MNVISRSASKCQSFIMAKHCCTNAQRLTSLDFIADQIDRWLATVMDRSSTQLSIQLKFIKRHNRLSPSDHSLPGPAPGPTLGIEYGKAFAFTFLLSRHYEFHSHFPTPRATLCYPRHMHILFHHFTINVGTYSTKMFTIIYHAAKFLLKGDTRWTKTACLTSV